MNLLEKMLRRKPKPRPMAPMPFAGSEAEQTEAARAAMDALRGSGPVTENSHRFPRLSDVAGAKPELLTKPVAARTSRDTLAPSVNIWDIEDEPAAAEPAKHSRSEPAAPEPAVRRRQSRTKTRMLGFEPQEASVVPLFEGASRPEEELEPSADAPSAVMFPTGWVVVKSGAGRGASFPLKQGLSMIGRGNDQAVRLDFGDMSISRSNHAAVAYDQSLHQFFIGHGGKSNLVRLNGRPLLSTEPLRDGDEIQVGETTLLIKVLCTPEFNWAKEKSGGEANDVAIA